MRESLEGVYGIVVIGFLGLGNFCDLLGARAVAEQ